MEIRYCKLFIFIVSLTISSFVSARPAEEAWIHINNKNFSAAQTILIQWLNKEPDNIDAKFLYARTLAWDNQYYNAITALNELINEHPENTEFLTTKANVLNWQNKTDSAIDILESARDISPGNKEIWQLEFKLLRKISPDTLRYKQLEHEYYLQFLEKFQSADDTHRLQIQRKNYLLVGKKYDHLNSNANDWHSTLIQFGTEVSKYHVMASLENSRRFGYSDNQAISNITKRINKSTQVTSELSVSSNSTLYAAWSFSLQGQKAINKVNIIAYKWQHRKYPINHTDTSAFSYSRYFGKLLPGITAYITSINNNDITLSYNASLSWLLTDNDFVRFSISQGNEVEYINDKSKISSIEFFGVDGRWNFTTDWYAIAALGHHKQGTYYTKDGIFIGLQRKF